MFQSELERKLKSIFGFKKVTFNAPGSFEQDTLFVDVQSAPSKVGKKKITSRVSGALTVYSHGDKFPFGFFTKRIEQAKAEFKKDFFFYDLDQNVLTSPARVQNICEIRGSFVFLFSAQYDPNQGTMNTIALPGMITPEPTLIDVGDGSVIETGEGVLRA